MAFLQWMGLAVTAAVLCLLVRQQQPQLGGLCAAAAGAMLLLAALEQLSDVREVFARLTAMAGLEEGYLGTLVKVLGVSYVAELAAQTCQDLGEGGLAALRHILWCDPRRLYSFTLDRESLGLLGHAAEAYTAARLERGFGTLDFYKSFRR